MSLELQKKRFLLLMKQYENEQERHHGWQSRFADIVGTSQTYISDLASQKDGRTAGAKVIEGAIAGFGLAREFFTDPSLGPAPNYRDFLGRRYAKASVTASAVSEATLQASLPQTVALDGSADYPTSAMRDAFFETDIGKITHPDDYDVVLFASYVGGPTIGKMMNRAATVRAMRMGKAVHEEPANVPMGANKLALGPAKKRR